MADGFNRVILVGNLGADPELRMTQSGQAVLNMRLATSETYLDRNKQRQERVEWHSVNCWGRRAEGLAKILTKGARICVEGSLRTSSWDDKNGEKRYRTEVVARDVVLCGGGQGGGQREGARYLKSQEPDYGAGGGGSPEDDDIPFAPDDWRAR